MDTSLAATQLKTALVAFTANGQEIRRKKPKKFKNKYTVINKKTNNKRTKQKSREARIEKLRRKATKKEIKSIAQEYWNFFEN